MTDTCGCCEGIKQITPVAIRNRPGLNALAYRVGTHATFLETMLASLSSLSITSCSDSSALHLTTRSTSDPAIALLDAWAMMGDVFTFYQERIANEGYLRTATQRRSILELARLVGYKLRPGVASSTYLAYTLQNGYDTLIPAGSRAQNIPAAGQLPQSFETSEDLQARAAWSNLQPRMSICEYITQNGTSTIDINTPDGALYLAGTSTNLKPHDPVLFVFSDDGGKQVFAHVQGVVPHAAEKYTSVTFPVGFTYEVFNRRFACLIQRYLNVDAFGLSLTNATVKQVVASLRNIARELPSQPLLGPDGTVGRTHSLISADVVQWHELHEIAAGSQRVEEKMPGENERQPRESTALALQLASWIGSLINEVESSLAEIKHLVRKEEHLETLSFPARSHSDTELPPVVITGLGTLIAPLRQLPNLQPFSSASLQRSLPSSFARSGDISSQLLAVFQPQISQELYRAYSQARVTPPPPLQEFDALRVKAAPFGSSAPKQAVTTEIPNSPKAGQNTFSTDYIEWPLAGSTIISIQFPPFPVSGSPVTLHFSLRGAVTLPDLSQSFTIPCSVTNVGPLPVGSPTITVEITQPNPPALGEIKVVIDSSTTIIVKPGDSEWNVEVTGGNVSLWYDTQNQLNISLTTLGISYVLDLDARYDHIVPESWVVIEGASSLNPTVKQKAIKIQKVETVTRADYGISAKVTRLTLYEPWLTHDDLQRSPLDLSLYRGITVYAQSEALPLADVPLTDDIHRQDVELDGLYDGLQSGRWLVVSGERTDTQETAGITASELMMLASVTQDVHTMQDGKPLPGDTIHTTLHFVTPLKHTYKRSTVTISGNVVPATQGETQHQVLGSGNSGTPMQQFSLAKSPLTYVPAVTPTGEESTLKVYVNNVRWQEIDNLDAAQGTDRVYITETDNQDKVTITFGNGIQGARLPTGNENVKAVYRTGIGTPGNVDAGKITQLISKPLGVKEVNNPIAATGGADRESRDQARRNIPLAATSLGRIVSVQDYADFARTFAGIGKASAAHLSDGQQEEVYVTIAGQDNIPIDTTSSLYLNLLQSLRTYGDPGLPLLLGLADVKLLVISARVHVQANYLFDDVAVALRAALLDAFSFERRDLGQPVFASEVLSVMQQVAGVAYVDLDVLDAIGQQQLTNALQQIQADALKAANTGQPGQNLPNLAALLQLGDLPVVTSKLARPESTQPGNILPAQLVFLSPDVQDTLILNELTTPAFKPAVPAVRRVGTRTYRRRS